MERTNSDQWKLYGNCELCRRQKYCSKLCKPAKNRQQNNIGRLFAEAMRKHLS